MSIIPRRHIDSERGESQKINKAMHGNPEERYVARFEIEFSRLIGTKHAIAVSSGRGALSLILQALELESGSEIIIPAYTLKDLVPVIEKLGLKPIAADIQRDTFNIDPSAIEKKITPKTRVILATHMFGNPCDIEKILLIAKKHNLYVVEDCAHSAGSKIGSKSTGSFGVAALFSFEAMKLINTYGGGMITTSDDKLAKKLRSLISGFSSQNSSIKKKFFVAQMEKKLLPTILGYPFLLFLSSPLKKVASSFYRLIQGHPKSAIGFSNLQAYLGLKRLRTLEGRIAKRQVKARLFASLIDKKIKPQKINGLSNYYLFVATVSGDAKKLRRKLLWHGFDAGIADEITDDCATFLGQKDCPVAKEIYERAILLPVNEAVSDKDIKRLAAIINRFYKSKNEKASKHHH